MRIRLILIAIACLLIGAAMTPIVSPSAKSGKGSSCKQPYRTTGQNGEYNGDRGKVKVRTREEFVAKFVTRVIVDVKPTSGHRVCKVQFVLTDKRKLSKKFPPLGGRYETVVDETKHVKGQKDLFILDYVIVFSRRK